MIHLVYKSLIFFLFKLCSKTLVFQHFLRVWFLFGVDLCYYMWSLWPVYFNTFTLQLPIPSLLSVPHKLPVFVFTRRKDIRSMVNAYKSNWPWEQSYYYQQFILKIWSFSYDLLKKLLTIYPCFLQLKCIEP